MSPLRRIAILVLATGLFLVSAVHAFSEKADNDMTSSRVNAIVRAAEKVGPAVVSINVLQTKLYGSHPLPGFFADPVIREGKIVHISFVVKELRRTEK